MASTTGRTLADAAGGPNAFNSIRLLAALAVVVSHAFELTGAAEPLHRATGGQMTIGWVAVGLFFVISGFLIPTSWERNSLARFVEKRARRILPALIAVVLLAVLVLGPLASALPAGRYFGRGETWGYLGHALFLPVSPVLPGVFTGLPNPAVNGSLWTLKFEVACYAAVPLLLMVRGRGAVLAAWLLSFAVARHFGGFTAAGTAGTTFYLAQFASLFRFFGAGMVLHGWAARIPLRAGWGWAAAAICAGSAFTPFFIEGLATAGSYALFVFAHCAPGWFRQLSRRGDISYGVYVYAFPIQQLLVGPAIAIGALAGIGAPFANAALALPLVLGAGVLSWRLVEKPALDAGRRPGAAPPPRPA